MTKFTKEVVDKFTLPVMSLKISVGGNVKTFTSPLAEAILAQVRAIKVGEGQVEYFDKDDNKHKSFTYCCGDYYEYDYTPKEYQVYGTEVDCNGMPVTYDEKVPGEVDAYKKAVKVKTTYADHLKDVRAQQFGTDAGITKVTENSPTNPQGRTEIMGELP